MFSHNFFRFQKPFFPALARPLFVFALFCNVLYGGYWIFRGLDSRYFSSHLILSGVTYLVLGPLVLRVIFEALLGLFRIEGHLAALRGQRSEAAAPFPSRETTDGRSLD